jgi:putative ABC transport system permease protein
MRSPSISILDLRGGSLASMYRWRLKRHAMQELLACGGIAIGVALFFGVLVANTSINGSAGQLVHQLIGSARLQVVARSSEGFDEHLAQRAGALPGVRVAAFVLREPAEVQGPKGRQLIQLIGVSPSLAGLRAAATRNLGAGTSLLRGGIGLPSSVANATGVQGEESVTLLADGDAHSVRVRAVLGSQLVGSVANSPIAIALLPVAQSLAERRGRVTNVLVKPQPGTDQQVKRELERLFAGRADVVPADNELALLANAARPTNQSTTLFAAISAMVGFLLALNAMILTVPERRRFLAELRMQGFRPGQVTVILGSQALILGLAASAIGVGLGDLLSRSLFHQIPSYLTFAFPVDSQQIVHPQTVLSAIACGVLAALLASLLPLLDLRRGRAADAVLHETGEAGQSIARRATLALSALGAILVLAVTAIVLLVPALTVIAGVFLALAVLVLIPGFFALVVWALTPISERTRTLGLAMLELRATATRSIALAGVAALAVYGSVAIQGARSDLNRGLNEAITQYIGTADVWVTTGDNVFTTDSFRAGDSVAAIGHSPGIASVRVYQGGLLDIGSRRLWIRARPPGDSQMLQSSQMLHGNLAKASRLIRHGGWASISNGLAEELHLHVGDQFTLPTPSGPARLGVAAITTNAGWPSGAITLNANDYSRYWQTNDPTALEINLKPGVSPAEGRRTVQSALGPRPGLRVQTRQEREEQFRANARQALRSLGQISTLLLGAAALAIAFALSTALWQRRATLAALKTQGFTYLQLWRALLLESTIMLTIGCTDGLILGAYGHALANRYMRLTTGFPAPFALGWPQMLLTIVLITGIALIVVAIPGLRSAQVSPRVSFQE